MSARVAILRFPGSNCEAESLRAVEQVGLSGRVVRWNEPAEELARFDAPDYATPVRLHSLAVVIYKIECRCALRAVWRKGCRALPSPSTAAHCP